jgi:hypothetical protein
LAIKTLSRAQAFSHGAQMWVTAQPEASPLYKKMDWYLNFQLSKAQFRKKAELSPQLITFLNENKLDMLAQAKSAPDILLISAAKNFPTKFVVVNKLKDKKKWVQELHQTWLGLERPELRVFLPTDFTADEFKTNWPKGAADDITVVQT